MLRLDLKSLYDLRAGQSQRSRQRAFTLPYSITATGRRFRHLSRHLNFEPFQSKSSFDVAFATLGAVKRP